MVLVDKDIARWLAIVFLRQTDLIKSINYFLHVAGIEPKPRCIVRQHATNYFTINKSNKTGEYLFK